MTPASGAAPAMPKRSMIQDLGRRTDCDCAPAWIAWLPSGHGGRCRNSVRSMRGWIKWRAGEGSDSKQAGQSLVTSRPLQAAESLEKRD
jgi:hypothetical protein